MTTECAICYVADANFVLPSLLSATRVRQFVSKDDANIFIFTVGVSNERIREINLLVSDIGIIVTEIPESKFHKLDRSRLAQTQTTLATFGRFFMDDGLPDSCKRIVYLDGDVWAKQNPLPLIRAIVPPGHFAAAEDAIFYRQRVGIGHTAQSIRAYFSLLGLARGKGYFNAGVFAVDRRTWRELSSDGYEYLISNFDKCKNFDQSALNAVVGDRRLRLSARWNFQTQFKIWGADRSIPPNIIHFNGTPKPWEHEMFPWATMSAMYKDAMVPYLSLKLPVRSVGDAELESYRTTRPSYAYLQWPLVSRLALLAMNFRAIEQAAWM